MVWDSVGRPADIHSGSVMAIEIRHTKRRIVYRVVVSSPEDGAKTVTKNFGTKAAAQAWEREMLQAGEERGTTAR
jgi:hypothetical protein